MSLKIHGRQGSQPPVSSTYALQYVLSSLQSDGESITQTFRASSGPDANPESKSSLAAALIFGPVLDGATFGSGLNRDWEAFLDFKDAVNVTVVRRDLAFCLVLEAFASDCSAGTAAPVLSGRSILLDKRISLKFYSR